jgi:mannose-6-phosphate isomerase
VPELLSVLDFTPLPAPYLAPTPAGRGVEEFRPDVPDFALWHVALDSSADASAASPRTAGIPLPGPAIALCTDGEFQLRGAAGAMTLRRGESAYITPDERALDVAGVGALFIATPND